MRPDCRKEQRSAAPARRSGAAAAKQARQKRPREAHCLQVELPPCRVFGPSTKRGSAPERSFPVRMRTAGRSSGSWALKRAPDRPSHSHWNSGRWPGRWPTRRRSRTGLITRFPFHSDRLNTCRSVLYKKVRKANRSGPAAGRENSQPSRSSSVSRVMYTGRCLVSR